ncbi:MAG: FtsX-like permease family protein [Actinomycetota bacterium]|nr:FtsX-like permease family protein [Actinomycetota bacterium]
MRKATVKGLLAHKLRLALTALSVVLGVAFVAGTFVLTDTINHTFDNLFTEVTAGVDVSVRARSGFGEGGGFEVQRDTVPETLVSTIERVDGVRAAEGSVGGFALLVNPEGEAIETGGAPTLGFNWTRTAELSPLRLREGRPPERDGEVVVDVGTAKRHDLTVGQTIRVIFRTGTGQYTIVGLTGFGKADNLAGATIAAFDLRTAQRVFGKPGAFDTIDAVGEEGVSPAELRRRVAAMLPPNAEAVTADQVARESASSIKDALSFFGTALLVFAAVSLIVGSFTIFNTFSILVAQRTRELALLRALGASRRQVLGSVLAEAAIVGLASSAVGLGLGVLFAIGLQGLLSAFGLDLPTTTLQFLPRTVIASFVVGLGATLVASILPARRAARVPPMAALRADYEVPAGSLRKRIVVGAAVTGLGLVALLGGLFGDVDNGLSLVGLGALLTFVGVAILSPLVARPLAGVIGAPLARVMKMSGKLGRQNAMRNPRRTAAAAAALMIGLGLVGTVSVLASSVKKSTTEVFDRSLIADFAISTQQFTPSISPSLAGDLAQRPELAAVTEVTQGDWRLERSTKQVFGATAATLNQTLNVDIVAGDYASLGRGDLLVSEEEAEDRNWSVGDVVPMTFAKSGTTEMRIGAIYGRNELLGSYTMSIDAFDAHFADRLDVVVLTEVAPGVSHESARRAMEDVAAEYPNVEVRDQAQVKADQRQQINSLLGLVTALLALAIVIALFGIVNTLALSVFERTRELGLLRAVGMSRRQIRSMVRTESVITSVIGALLGLAVGVFFGFAVVRALSSEGIASVVVPFGQLITYVVLAALAGTLAAIWPARRAARLDVLAAISYE